MHVPSITIGDIRSVLRRGPSPMKNVGDWGQIDSDILAHLLQVWAQIAKSRWNQVEISFSTQGPRLLRARFPAFEDFVFVAVYFRQLIAKNDRLMQDAVQRHARYADSPARVGWVGYELQGFEGTLDRNCSPKLRNYTPREVFDAFMYGSGLMHKAPDLRDRHRARFLEIYDNEKREDVLFALNMSLKLLLNNVTRIASVIEQDLGHWLVQYDLPRPDVRWHDRLFEVTVVEQ